MRGPLAVTVLGAVMAIGGRPLAAQPTRPPARPDSARADTARADTARADTVRARTNDPTRRDSLVLRAVADSLARDSAVARARRASAARTPTVLDQLGIDRLRLSAFGIAAGTAWPRRVEPAPLYALTADYGELAPGLHLVFGGAYWSSRYQPAAVRAFGRAVGEVAGVDSVVLGEIRTSVLMLAGDVRWYPRDAGRGRGARTPRRPLRPFVGGGLALHLPDIEGAPLSGTFVEQTLDAVAVGVGASAGLDLALLPNVTLTMHARYDLFNGAAFASLRAGASYVFDAAPDPARAARAAGHTTGRTR